MGLKHDTMDRIILETAQTLKLIDTHGAQIAEAEALAEQLQEAGLDCCPMVEADPDNVKAYVLAVAARDSEIRAAISKADLRLVESRRLAKPWNHAARYTLHGLSVSLDVPVIVEELQVA